MKPIADIIGEVVASMRVVGEETPYYMHGHVNEMINTLVEKDKAVAWKNKKFPCIMLIQDFDEKINGSVQTATLRIIIAAHTKQGIKAADRYALTFRPILYPLLDLFIAKLKRNNNINQSNFEFTKTDRLYWGEKGEANVANDYVDAIELSDFKINVINKC